MASSIFSKKEPFEKVSPCGDDFMSSINALRNEAKKITRQECRLQKLIKLLRQLESRKIRVVTPRELLKLIEK